MLAGLAGLGVQVDTLPRLEGVWLAPTAADPVFVTLHVGMILVGLGLALRESLTCWWLPQKAAGAGSPA